MRGLKVLSVGLSELAFLVRDALLLRAHSTATGQQKEGYNQYKVLFDAKRQESTSKQNFNCNHNSYFVRGA